MIRGCLIRHGMTRGNLLGRYIGKRSDEDLSPEGIDLCRGRTYPHADVVFASPMRRCVQTAEYLFCDKKPVVQERLSECDFGIFEGRNYQELSGEPRYQEWVDSGGTLPFPEGESREEFQDRCLEGFSLCIKHCIQHHYEKFAMVVHGGTIMSILDAFAVPSRNYFDWQVQNLEGYEIEIDEQQWSGGKHEIFVLREGADIWK